MYGQQFVRLAPTWGLGQNFPCILLSCDMTVRSSLLSDLKAFISLVFASLSYFNLTFNTVPRSLAWVGKAQWRHQLLCDQVESSLLLKACRNGGTSTAPRILLALLTCRARSCGTRLGNFSPPFTRTPRPFFPSEVPKFRAVGLWVFWPR